MFKYINFVCFRRDKDVVDERGIRSVGRHFRKASSSFGLGERFRFLTLPGEVKFNDGSRLDGSVA